MRESSGSGLVAWEQVDLRIPQNRSGSEISSAADRDLWRWHKFVEPRPHGRGTLRVFANHIRLLVRIVGEIIELVRRSGRLDVPFFVDVAVHIPDHGVRVPSRTCRHREPE